MVTFYSSQIIFLKNYIKKNLTKIYAFLENKLLKNNISLKSESSYILNFGIDELLKMNDFSQEEDRIGRAVVNAAYHVHKELGPGLLEKVYEVCFCHVLEQNGFNIKRQ